MNKKALPDGFTIDKSPIHGLGLFSTEEIRCDTLIGVVLVSPPNIRTSFHNDFIRTPLGGFGNHSDDPNCKKIFYNDVWWIKSIEDIKPNEEITWGYTLYKVGLTEDV